MEQKHYGRVSERELEEFTPERKERRKRVYTFFLWGKKFTTEDKKFYDEVTNLK